MARSPHWSGPELAKGEGTRPDPRPLASSPVSTGSWSQVVWLFGLAANCTLSIVEGEWLERRVVSCLWPAGAI